MLLHTGCLDDWNWNRDHRGRIYISYDFTNKNSDVGDISIVEFRKAKDDKELPVFNLSIAMDKTNRVPLFYEDDRKDQYFSNRYATHWCLTPPCKSQKSLDVLIARFTRFYDPTMLLSDTKAISQFIRKGIVAEDIVLKSAGTQNYSYTYMVDAIYGLLTIVLCGESGEAYNTTDEASNITLKDLAQIIAEHAGRKVVFEIPDAVEVARYCKATKALLDGSKLKKLGWKPFYAIKDGIPRTVDILKSIGAIQALSHSKDSITVHKKNAENLVINAFTI